MKRSEKIVNFNKKTFIWIDEKCFKKEENKLKKFKHTKTISIESFIFDICPFEIKINFKVNKKEINEFCKIYHYTVYYDEWGAFKEKPIIFMELIKKKSIIKSKKPFKINELLKCVEEEPNFELNIYFETVMAKDPLEKDYKEKDNLFFSYLGGLYYIILNNENLQAMVLRKKSMQPNIDETYKTAICLRNSSYRWKTFLY